MNSGNRPWFESNLDYLQAVNAWGFLHASTCDSPPGFGEAFRVTMERQGMTVTRYTPAQLVELRASQSRTRTEEAPVVVAEPLVELPAIGMRVTLPEWGNGEVTTLLRDFEGTVALVVRTRRGEHLARPGGWTLTPEGQEQRPAAATEEEAPLSTVVNTPSVRACTMPSLFDLGAGA